MWRSSLPSHAKGVVPVGSRSFSFPSCYFPCCCVPLPLISSLTQKKNCWKIFRNILHSSSWSSNRSCRPARWWYRGIIYNKTDWFSSTERACVAKRHLLNDAAQKYCYRKKPRWLEIAHMRVKLHMCCPSTTPTACWSPASRSHSAYPMVNSASST